MLVEVLKGFATLGKEYGKSTECLVIAAVSPQTVHALCMEPFDAVNRGIGSDGHTVSNCGRRCCTSVTFVMPP